MKNDIAASFSEEKYDQSGGDADHDHLQVEDPSPGDVIGDNATEERSQACTDKDGEGVHGHGGVPVCFVVNIADDSTYDGSKNRGTTPDNES